VNGGKWRQEKHTDIFGHQSSIFPLVDSLVIINDEIFQTLVVEGVLLPKLFLDPHHPTHRTDPT
jgi:hypothetical protein